MKKIANAICVGAGFLFLGIGVIGILLPVLPTTPFLILAGILFAKGSDRFHKWFMSTKIYQKHIHTVLKDKAMTKRAKSKVLATVLILFTIGFLVAPIWHAKVLIIAVAVFHIYYFSFRIRTKKEVGEIGEGA